ncbi:hypothetical protein QL285_032700 [Trifolium repens]|nr:hypothetical protein QL285_032700 [Trifolium repens]
MLTGERKRMFVGEWRLLDAREGLRNVAEDERLRTMSNEEFSPAIGAIGSMRMMTSLVCKRTKVTQQCRLRLAIPAVALRTNAIPAVAAAKAPLHRDPAGLTTLAVTTEWLSYITKLSI